MPALGDLREGQPPEAGKATHNRLVVGSLRDARGETCWLLNSPAGNGKKAAEPLPRGGWLKAISFGAILSGVKMMPADRIRCSAAAS
jgi:hypothetical protein